MTRTVEPEGCGASYRREAVLAASSNDPPDRVLGQAVTELRDGGWSQVECVSAYERCFERGRHFVAMTTPDGARERDVSGYPAPVGTGHAQLLVVVEER